MQDDIWSSLPFPNDGQSRLKALLVSLGENTEKLTSHPLYKEGWDDGYLAAQDAYRKLTYALSKVYQIDVDS